MVGPIAMVHPLPSHQLELLRKDLVKATTAISTWTQSRCDYWIRLPWALAGLASPYEDKARELACRLCESFDRDPRGPPVHHHQTWSLMKADAPFRQDLNRFVSGVPRDHLSPQTLVQIARLKFMPVAETTIESKHQNVSHSKRNMPSDLSEYP